MEEVGTLHTTSTEHRVVKHYRQDPLTSLSFTLPSYQVTSLLSLPVENQGRLNLPCPFLPLLPSPPFLRAECLRPSLNCRLRLDSNSCACTADTNPARQQACLSANGPSLAQSLRTYYFPSSPLPSCLLSPSPALDRPWL